MKPKKKENWEQARQQAFIAQKNEPNGKKTMLSYIWSLEKVAYDQAHNG